MVKFNLMKSLYDGYSFRVAQMSSKVDCGTLKIAFNEQNSSVSILFPIYFRYSFLIVINFQLLYVYWNFLETIKFFIFIWFLLFQFLFVYMSRVFNSNVPHLLKSIIGNVYYRCFFDFLIIKIWSKKKTLTIFLRGRARQKPISELRNY